MRKAGWIVAVTFVFVSEAGFAQTGEAQTKERGHRHHHHAHKEHRHGGKWEANIKEYIAKLNLTPLQLTHWQALHGAEKQEFKALKENTELSQEEKRTQMKAIRQNSQAELKKILSAEQFAQYQELRKENIRERRAQGHRKGDLKKGVR